MSLHSLCSNQSSSANDISKMLKSNPLAALTSTFGRRKGKASRLDHRKGGPLAEARENVRRVHRQVLDFEQSCARREVDETDRTIRCVHGFFNAVRYHEDALTGYSEDNVEAMDSLERASGDLVAAASTLYAIDPVLYQAKVGVSLLAGVRGLDSKEAFERYLADLEVIAEDRRARAAWLKERTEEGYTDANGVERSPADLAEKAKRDAARRANPMASRLSPAGQGRQDAAAHSESMRSKQDRDINSHRRLREKIDAAHKERNAPPPPRGARRAIDGYRVQSYIAGELENPATWDIDEITRRVAEFRERNGVPGLDPNVHGTYVLPEGDGWRVQPPVAELRKLGLKERAVYNPATRSSSFSAEAEGVAALEKFLAPSTSDVERKAMMRRPREAFICAHCGRDFFKGKGKDEGRCVAGRQAHERYCAERSSSSEEEESDEDESEEESDEDDSEEEEESEEVVAPPSPKRARFFSWPW